MSDDQMSMLEDVIRDMRNKQLREIEKLVQAMPVGAILCVHDSEFKLNENRTIFTANTEAHVLKNDSEQCSTWCWKTQYGPKPSEEVPLVSYLDGERKVVGTARYFPDAEGIRVESIVQDPEATRRLREHVLGQISIAPSTRPRGRAMGGSGGASDPDTSFRVSSANPFQAPYSLGAVEGRREVQQTEVQLDQEAEE